MIATTRLKRREELFQVCRRIVNEGDSDTIYPHQELLRRLILAHAQDPKAFEWQRVNMLSFDFEDSLGDWELIRNDALSAEQRESARTANAAFDPVWKKLKPKLAEVFSRYGEKPPRTFADAVSRALSGSNLIWGIGKLLYDHVAKQDVQEPEIQRFMSTCPPFRAIVYAFLMMWYEGAVRDAQGQRIKAGRTDLFIAAHLPYCDQFITNDKPQEECLREIAVVAGLSTVIRSYDDFCDGFLVRESCTA